MNSRRMRRAVTICAQRHHHVLVLVAVDTGQRLVLRGVGKKLLIGDVVAGRAMHVRQVVVIDHMQRLVRAVAARAVCVGLLGRMGTVALYAIGNITVGIRMTEITRDILVSAGMSGKLLPDGHVAGQTFVDQITLEGQLQRGMGVGVTLRAIGQIKMRRAGMTHGAGGNGIRHCRGMPNVAVKAVDCGFVRTALFSNFPGLRLVAFDAIGVLQNSRFGLRGKPNRKRQPT
ncbi:hypothetical protein GFER_11315 [Geoalkalibacter ferrihydriticus DSM 17813]|uniref:Uncharacterized protein n=1 Tax=Geoalkalibacter ferrihydriticus DSM 17813 TaxID=1121915 RepID=A0A0C2HGX8_9BACT|nr:hypothetical protein GFER_11315 [Geoalkalibacter ferrihydriticus DSM 17813]